MNKHLHRIILLSVFLSISQNCQAKRVANSKAWYLDTMLYTQHTTYKDSLSRDSLNENGLLLSMDYLDRGGIRLGYNKKNIKFLQSSGLADIDENSLFVGGELNFYSDSGRVGLQLDFHKIKDESNYTDQITVLYPVINYLNNSKTFYLDLGYSDSKYHADTPFIDDLDITQYTTTVGFAFNDQFDWLQFKGYVIEPTLSNRLLNIENKSALEIQWVHWPSEETLGLEKVIINLMSGERIFAVDSATKTVYNLADIQTQSLSFTFQWRAGLSTNFSVSAGASNYEGLITNDIYTSNYFYINASKQW